MALPPKPDFSKEVVDPEALRLFQAASTASDRKEKKKLLKQADAAQSEYIQRVRTLGIRGAITRKAGRKKKHRTRRRYLGRKL